MNYSSIDPIINAWIDRDGLHLYTKYQDAEVGALVFQTRKEEFMRLALSQPEPTPGRPLNVQC
jgi:hypothetical protein